MKGTKRISGEALRNLPYAMIDEVTNDREGYAEFLKFYSRFYKYDIVNALLIYRQAPDATAVGTYKQWTCQAIRRGVRKGAFPIKLLHNGSWETAFDITDTYGKAFPFAQSHTLTEQEMQRLTVPLGVSERNISSPAKKIEYFFASSIISGEHQRVYR